MEKSVVYSSNMEKSVVYSSNMEKTLVICFPSFHPPLFPPIFVIYFLFFLPLSPPYFLSERNSRPET